MIAALLQSCGECRDVGVVARVTFDRVDELRSGKRAGEQPPGQSSVLGAEHPVLEADSEQLVRLHVIQVTAVTYVPQHRRDVVASPAPVAAIAAPAARHGAVVDDRLVVVSTLAPPPRLAVRADLHHLWCQVAVLRGMPLGSDFRAYSCEVIDPNDDRSSRAVRTSTADWPSAAGDLCLVVVTVLAPPPRLAARTGRHHLWCQVAVLRGVPLGGDFRAHSGEVIEPGKNRLPGTVGAAGADWPSAA